MLQMNRNGVEQTMIFVFLFFFFLAPIHAQQLEPIGTPELKISNEYQSDNLCGPNGLFVVCKLLNIEAKRDELARVAGMDERGTTLYGLKKAALQKGLYAVGVETTVPQLRKLPPPMIAQVHQNHFLIVNGFEGDWVHIIDAPKEPYALLLTDFEKIWTGKALIVSKEKVEIEFSHFRYTIIAFVGFFLVSVICLIFALRRKIVNGQSFLPTT